MGGQGLRFADARDYTDQAVTFDNVGDAEALVFPEIGSAVISGGRLRGAWVERAGRGSSDSPIETIEPEYFVFADNDATGYLRGFRRRPRRSPQDLARPGEQEVEPEEDPLVVGATWGLIACKVPPSLRSGVGIKVAVLDTGLDLGHPDFAGRAIVSQPSWASPCRICTAMAPTASARRADQRHRPARPRATASPTAHRSSWGRC